MPEKWADPEGICEPAFPVSRRELPASRERSPQEVWGHNRRHHYTLETYIYRLRQKIEKDAANPEILVTEAVAASWCRETIAAPICVSAHPGDRSMSIEDDAALSSGSRRWLVGNDSAAMSAIGSEQRDFSPGDYLFNPATRRTPAIPFSAARFASRSGRRSRCGPGSLIGELALIVAMKRPSSAVARQHSRSSGWRAACFNARSKAIRARAPPARRARRPDEPVRAIF